MRPARPTESGFCPLSALTFRMENPMMFPLSSTFSFCEKAYHQPHPKGSFYSIFCEKIVFHHGIVLILLEVPGFPLKNDFKVISFFIVQYFYFIFHNIASLNSHSRQQMPAAHLPVIHDHRRRHALHAVQFPDLLSDECPERTPIRKPHFGHDHVISCRGCNEFNL